MLTTNTYTCITGASSGIGRAAAKKFAEQGHNLIIIARRKQLLEELAHELMHQFPAVDVVVKTTDLSLPEHALALYNELHGYHITTWINNAGFGNYASVAEQDLTKISKLLHLNIETLTLLSRLYVKDYRNQAGLSSLISHHEAATQSFQTPSPTAQASFTLVPLLRGLPKNYVAVGFHCKQKY